MNGASIARSAAAAAVLVAAPSCARVAVEPIEVKPIHITMDVNIRVQRELENFFAFEEQLLKDPSGGGAGTSTTTQAAPPTGAGAPSETTAPPAAGAEE